MPSHEHSHGNKKGLWAVLILSAIYMVAEIVGGVFSGSLALLADAGHMAIDVAAIGVGLFAAWISQKPPTDDKTFGYYRAEILAALLNGSTLIAISFWIAYEAWQRFNDPSAINGEVMTLVALGGLVVNVAGLRIIHKGGGSNLNVRAVWLHLMSDAMGSISAIVGGVLVWRFGWEQADSIVSALIALLILNGAWRLVSECVNVLLEGVPKGIRIPDVKKGMEAFSSVQDVHDLHVWMVTSGVNALSAHLRLKPGVDASHALHEITEWLRTKFHIEHTTLQLEASEFSHKKLHF